jgi:hypothetical protein
MAESNFEDELHIDPLAEDEEDEDENWDVVDPELEVDSEIKEQDRE